jgi:hypothetical protein
MARPRFKVSVVRGAALGILALGAVAVPFAMTRGSAAQPGPGAVTNIAIISNDYSFDAPDMVAAGLVAITLTNEGQEPHHAQLFRLKDDVALETFFAQLQMGPEAALALVTSEGGPGTISPGQRQDVVVDLDPGTYVMLCFVGSPDGVPHVAKGMIKPFRVLGTTAEATMRDFSFTLPEFQAGVTDLKLINEGPQPHELALVKLKAGRTLDDALAFFQGTAPPGPPPFDSAGGFQAMEAGALSWGKLTLTSGNYVALCNVPDPASGKSHAELGMIAPFTVE